MRVRLYFFFAAIYLCCLITLLPACKKEDSDESRNITDSASIHVVFHHAVKNTPLDLTDEYVNDWGETYTIRTFKYYIHDIKLVGSEGNIIPLSSDYFLVDENDAESKHLIFSAPAGAYTAIVYTLGVDSARNVSGAQTDALDPAKGMFWTWNSGYVMAKLEGNSPVSTGLNNEFTYHVGGFKSPYITIKEISLPLPGAQGVSVSKDAILTFNIQADINTWFSHYTPVKIAENPACHSPGELAKKLADNYEAMFSIESVE